MTLDSEFLRAHPGTQKYDGCISKEKVAEVGPDLAAGRSEVRLSGPDTR